MFRVVLLSLLVSPLGSVGASPLDHVRRARALLGGETWARIVRVENTNLRSVYPATVYGLVFELGGLLWFYTDTDGTQSFSLHRNKLAEEKRDFAPLLRDIESGFASHTILTDAAEEADEKDLPVSKGPLPNGCLIESYVALRERAASGELILRARLLSYYVRGRRAGHTVLAYETPAGLRVIDPAVSEEPRKMKRPSSDDPLLLARKLRRDLEIAEARWGPTIQAFDVPRLAAVDGAAKSSRASETASVRSANDPTQASQVAGS